RGAGQAGRAALHGKRRPRRAGARRRRDLSLRQRAAGARARRAAPRHAHDHQLPAHRARPFDHAHRPRGDARRRTPLSLRPRHGIQQRLARAGAAQRRARALRVREEMSRIALACAVACLGASGVIASGAVLAEKADRDMPTQIEANKMSADDARRMTVFEGSVVLTRGTIRLTADRVVVRQDAEGFQFATATGKPARFRQRQDPKPPETEGVWLEGEALRMEMDDRSGKIELYDSAHVKRGGDEVAGNYILLDQRSDYFSVSTGKETPSGKEGATAGGRVKAVIQPKPRPPEAK